MAKLGIIIDRTFEGRSVAYSANRGEWASEVRDIRTLHGQLQGVSENEIPLLLTYAKDGVFLVLIRAIYGRVGDNITAWIHIPSNINIAGRELEDVVKHVSKAISGTTLKTDSLDDIFKREYESDIAKHIVDVPANEKIAIREYAGDTIFNIQLSTLLDSKYLFQPVYSQYKYVFFVDNKKSHLSCPTGTKLKDANVVESVIVRPVEDKDGFSLFYRNEKFTTPFFAYKAEKLTFVWKRAGYKEVHVEYEVKEGSPIPAISRKDIKKYVNRNSITVRDKETKKRLSDYRVIVLGLTLTEEKPLLAVSIDAINDVEVVVEAAGYNTYGKKHDLNGPVILDLEPKTYTYTFRFPTKDGYELKAEVESKGLLKCTPFQGYHNRYGQEPYEDGVNDLIYAPFDRASIRKTWIIRLICFVIGLVLGVFAAAYVAKETIDELKSKQQPKEVNHSKYSAAQSDQQNEETKKPENNYDLIIEYMDNQIKWVKTDLDNYPEIVKLWDALNTYDFDNIKKYREPLKNSVKFKALISAIENKNREDYPETYNNPGDLEITIDRYIEKVKTQNQAQSKADSKPKEKEESKPRNEYGRNK